MNRDREMREHEMQQHREYLKNLNEQRKSLVKEHQFQEKIFAEKLGRLDNIINKVQGFIEILMSEE